MHAAGPVNKLCLMEDWCLIHSREGNFLFATTRDVVCAPLNRPAELAVNLTSQAGDEVKNVWT